MITTLSLVFGGCCSNALTLEKITADYSDAGSLLTFLQFLVVALYGLRANVVLKPFPRLRPTKVPLGPYLVQVTLFAILSLLNNAAFAYDIPMSVHIIFRSGGLVVSMFVGWILAGKRYPPLQIISVIVVTAGIILTTMSASRPSSATAASSGYSTGIIILTLALILAAFLGLTQEWIYANYTQSPSNAALPHQESMFYLHFLALPGFIPLRHSIQLQFRNMLQSPPSSFFNIPTALVSVLLNTVTQVFCVAGVHRLTTSLSTLTVTLILVVRKAVSLIISVIFLSNNANVNMLMLLAGASLVFGGTVLYTMGAQKKQKKE